MVSGQPNQLCGYVRPFSYDRVVVKATATRVRAVNRMSLAAAGPLNTPSGGSARWTFDEGGGTVAADSSGNGNHATLLGAVAHTSWTNGRYGKAVLLSGYGPRLAAGRAVVRTDQSFTVSAWARLDRKEGFRTAVSQDGTYGSGFYLQYSGADDRWAFSMLAADATGADGVRVLSGVPPAVGTWTHLTGVYDAQARQLRFYVNGSLVGSRAYQAWHAVGTTHIGSAKWNGEQVDFWAGAIDEVRLDSRALTSEEVRARYLEPS